MNRTVYRGARCTLIRCHMMELTCRQADGDPMCAIRGAFDTPPAAFAPGEALLPECLPRRAGRRLAGLPGRGAVTRPLRHRDPALSHGRTSNASTRIQESLAAESLRPVASIVSVCWPYASPDSMPIVS